MIKDQADKKKNEKVLRAKDIIPPYNNKIPREQTHSLKDGTSQHPRAKAELPETLPPEHEDSAQQKSEIPQFNLANQILSEQRKVAAIKRQRPGLKNEDLSHKQQLPSTTYTLKPPPMLSQQEKIIAEIVARDILRLRKSNI